MVSVVVPSFNRIDRLRQCLQSVSRSEPRPAGGVQVIVVTSTYDEGEIAEIEAIGAVVVRLNGTVLASEARNAGTASATGQYVLFLDDDNVLAPDAIRRLQQAFELWPDTTVAGPVMYYASAPDRIWCAGVSRSHVFMKTRFVTSLPDPPPDRLPSEDFPNCFMVRRRDFTEIGGFDALQFPVHMEESDLARRLLATRGGRACCIPSAKVWHFIGTGFARRVHMPDPQRAYWVARGRSLFTAVYGTRLQWLTFVFISQWLLAGIYLATALAQGVERADVVPAYVRGMLAGIASGMRARRQAVMRPSYSSE